MVRSLSITLLYIYGPGQLQTTTIFTQSIYVYAFQMFDQLLNKCIYAIICSFFNYLSIVLLVKCISNFLTNCNKQTNTFYVFYLFSAHYIYPSIYLSYIVAA